MLAIVFKAAVDLLARRLALRNGISGEPSLDSSIHESIGRHLAWVSSWCTTLQFFPLSSPTDLISSTSDLRYVEPRRFIVLNQESRNLTEAQLFAESKHFIITGGPGSGKTTTLKRLCSQLLAEPTIGDSWEFPVVIRFRDLSTTLDLGLAQILGIKYSTRTDAVAGAGQSQIHQTVYVVGDIKLEDFLVRLFDDLGAVILLDGLDEVAPDFFASALKLIQHLSYGLKTAKLIVTVRAGEVIPQLENVQFLEMAPLSFREKECIVERWLGASSRFLIELAGLPFQDLAERPLFLGYLLVIFKRFGDLPQQPSELYEQFVRLLLRDWDEQRGVARRSKYAVFGPDRKLKFLSALAYHLTYNTKATTFNSSMLRQVYSQIHRDFGLPASEESQVVNEIESHTGLIASAPRNCFEFSHLSLQEYLCANHMVREPYPAFLPSYIADYPSPVAVAIALSSNPSDWFAGLVLRDESFKQFSYRSYNILLERLRSERAYFRSTPILGLAILRMLDNVVSGAEVLHHWVILLGESALFNVLTIALEYYKEVPDQHSIEAKKVRLERVMAVSNVYGLTTPKVLYLPDALIAEIYNRSGQ